MFDDDFQYQENSLDIILRFPSETEQSPFGDDHFTPLLIKDSHSTSPLLPMSDDDIIPGLINVESS